MDTAKQVMIGDGADGSVREKDIPLFVDVDGTLTRADVSIENMVRVARSSFANFFMVLLWLFSGKAVFKSMLARRSPVDPKLLPYQDHVLVKIKEAQALGRPVILASASHRRHIIRIARHLGLSANVIATTKNYNCKGVNKLVKMQAYAKGPFDYIGDSRADYPIWQAARQAWTAGVLPNGSLSGHVKRLGAAPKPMAITILKAMRPHQWAKNALVLVPAFTSGLFLDPVSLLTAAAAAILMSLVASSIYLINDMVDIDADRIHRTKWKRPLAHGDLPIPAALITSFILSSAGLIGAFILGGLPLMFWFLAYTAITVAYSVRLKSAMIIDVITLAILYTIRIWIGGVAIGVALSFWLLLFSIFLFLSLSYLKRYIELRDSPNETKLLSGRGYVRADLDVVMASGVAAGMLAIMILGLYVDDPAATVNFTAPDILLFLCVPLLYWLNRIWMMARRGEVNGDPVAFALKDRRTHYLGVIMGGIFIAAYFGLPEFLNIFVIVH